MISRGQAEALDLADPLRAKRQLFVLPEKTIYLDGNSLGPLPRHVAARLAGAVAEEWGQSLIRGWNAHGWFDLPRLLGDRIGGLIGAEPGTVLAADSTSINLAKVLTAALALRPDRRVILSDSGNFPSDLYVAQGVIKALGGGRELRIVGPEEVEEAISDDLAVLMLTEVDYRTGRRHDMKTLIAKAQGRGALAIWDLCHSAGAFPVDLAGANTDFAVGCGYKYLNGGPGAPAFVYVRPDLQNEVVPSLSGWMGHEAPFAFDLDYRPAKGIDRLRAGTPGVLSMIALSSALDVWDGVDLKMLRDKSVRLAELFISEVEGRCGSFGLKLASPRDAERRGSQVSFHCADGYAVMQALIAEGVIGDFRAPDIIRFGLTPLYIGFADIWDAARILERVLAERLWDRPQFKKRAAVT
ncbi:kynureninase [Nordella sp. HKS 07]|uniref:kynureninase n=1 Tax=Nordella sp. HKS 07 TaxID=2712222 RepID=UPI0013E10D9D|nr:kynureninase [Nordella sp. HKS 07]QIG47708.1 kynureninase [Nordella sp. HKS 07]